MKNMKYFLRGLGTGLLVAAIVLCTSYRKSNSEVNVVEQAKELGMVFPEGTESPDQPTETPAVDSGAAVTTASDDSDKAEKKATESPDSTKKPTATKKPKTTKKSKATEKPNETITVTIRDASQSGSVAKELEKAGVVDDADAFDKYLVENGYGKKVRGGIYKITKGTSYEEIAKMLTHAKS